MLLDGAKYIDRTCVVSSGKVVGRAVIGGEECWGGRSTIEVYGVFYCSSKWKTLGPVQPDRWRRSEQGRGGGGAAKPRVGNTAEGKPKGRQVEDVKLRRKWRWSLVLSKTPNYRLH